MVSQVVETLGRVETSVFPNEGVMIGVRSPERDVYVKTAGADRAIQSLDSGRSPTSFPTRDDGLGRAQPLGKLLLGEPGATPGFPNELSASSHGNMILPNGDRNQCRLAMDTIAIWI